MVCVFLSFVLGEERVIQEFGLSLASAVFLDALVVRCMLLPALLHIVGERTWRFPGVARSATAAAEHRGHLGARGAGRRGDARAEWGRPPSREGRLKGRRGGVVSRDGAWSPPPGKWN